MGKLASGRQFTSLPVRVVASLYLMSLACFTVWAWAALMLHHPAWASALVQVGLLILMLTVLAEGLLPRWRPAKRV